MVRTMKKLIAATAALSTLAVPAVASANAKPVSDYFKDGKTTVREARSEISDLLSDKTTRADVFRVPADVAGRPSTAADPAIRSTTFKISRCQHVSRATVNCDAIVRAYKTRRPSKHVYRTDHMALSVTAWQDHSGGATDVISERFS